MKLTIAILLLTIMSLVAAEGPSRSGPELVIIPTKSPVVTFRIVLLRGAADDPKGQEGVAALTAAMLAEGGTKKLTYEEIVKRMYPMATSFGWQIDKEMTVFTGSTHVDNLDKYYALIREMLLEPGFRDEDFQRLKSDAMNFLKVSLREGNDEELGKERLYGLIYKDHPYGHHNMGKVSSLEKLTLEQVRAFYAKQYTSGSFWIGLAGNLPAGFAEKIRTDFGKLPSGGGIDRTKTSPTLASGAVIDLVQRETRSTGISIGFPINVRRGDKDWAALALAASYFGQHRSSYSYLYQKLREARGLNYGDYSYIEYFPRGMYQFEPDPNQARDQQIFQIWIRPVQPEHGHFALRAALFEYDNLVKNGITKEAFEDTRQFLTKYVDVLTQSQDGQLGYALDSKYYGIPVFNDYLKSELAKLTVEDVNRAIKTHLKSDSMRIAIVTKDAEGLRKAIVENSPSPITYNSPKPEDILAEDKIISTYKLTPKEVRVTPVSEVFQ
ncbi:MAG TPA: pitrilysin family protein [Methylomirabilota bacterium]|nr:pitrilysin family protein [Methylomirabilota bacterium]